MGSSLHPHQHLHQHPQHLPPKHQLQLQPRKRKKDLTMVLSLVVWLVELLVWVPWEEQSTCSRRSPLRSEVCSPEIGRDIWEQCLVLPNCAAQCSSREP